MLARLGLYKFELDTAAYDELKRTTEYRWAKVNRLDKRPAKQFTGRGDDTITIKGTIYPDYKGGLNQLNLMRSMAGLGEPLPLFFAYGDLGSLLGLWVIDSITEGQKYFHTNGQPRSQKFTMKISHYGDDLGDMAADYLKSSAKAGLDKLAKTDAVKSMLNKVGL